MGKFGICYRFFTSVNTEGKAHFIAYQCITDRRSYKAD